MSSVTDCMLERGGCVESLDFFFFFLYKIVLSTRVSRFLQGGKNSIQFKFMPHLRFSFNYPLKWYFRSIVKQERKIFALEFTTPITPCLDHGMMILADLVWTKSRSGIVYSYHCFTSFMWTSSLFKAGVMTSPGCRHMRKG